MNEIIVKDALFKTERRKNSGSGKGRQVDMSAHDGNGGSVSRAVRISLR